METNILVEAAASRCPLMADLDILTSRWTDIIKSIQKDLFILV